MRPSSRITPELPWSASWCSGSLLWRIRRATAIETDLLQIQAEILSDRRLECATGHDAGPKPRAIGPSLRRHSGNGSSHDDQGVSSDDPCDPLEAPRDDPGGISRNLTYCFLRLANLDNGVFERLARYEAALWRQIVQTLFAPKRSGAETADRVLPESNSKARL
jgi:hypothetical protein